MSQPPGKAPFWLLIFNYFACNRGKIWRVKKEFAHSLWDKKHKKEPSFDEKKDAIETIATVNGNWIESLEIDGKK